ncbi:hypothetical protein [Mycolicibacterium austroafricanum]|uniref:hypothetical protein n=1 Tax=Mycolicibacterium austroafricanum TaxID=39687 RepID=UPI001CA33166|nr:hypothetical protein [Mycolicibacterium austroafricanum]QZT57120.1 hypothetical protein JN084_00325 [Mycolicibacterium austroafricanum]
MGYFAVLKPADATDDVTFDITRCHINVWVLRSFIPGRRLLYFDLGLEIAATGTAPVGAVEVLLPFKVEEGSKGDQFKQCMDLYDALSNDVTAELIFGEPLKVSGTPQNRTLELESGDELHPRHIDTAKVAAVTEEPLPRSSCYRVPLENPVPNGSKAYIRFRFRVFANRPLLTSKSLFGGVILDFRIADVRESRTRSREASIRRRIVPVEKVNFFAMLPDQYQLLTASSEPRNMRILETRAWGNYLDRVAYMHPSNTQLVYYWRNEGKPVSPDNPFRVFASYDRHLNKAKIFFWCAVALLLTSGIVRFGWIPGVTTDTLRMVLGHLASALGLLGIGILGIIMWGVKVIVSRFERLRMKARWIERLLLGMRPGP